MQIENIFKMRHNPELYIQDYMKFYLRKSRKAIIETALLFLVAGILWTLLTLNIIDDVWSHAPSSIVVIACVWVGILFYNFAQARKSVIIKSNEIPSTVETMTLYNNRVDITQSGRTTCIFFSQLKSVQKIGSTLFLMTKVKNSWPFRFNENEITGFDSESMKIIIEKRMKNVR